MVLIAYIGVQGSLCLRLASFLTLCRFKRHSLSNQILCLYFMRFYVYILFS